MGLRAQRTVRRMVAAIIGAATLCTFLAFTGRTAATASGDEAQAFVEAINASRSSLAGVEALQADGDLTRVANDHAAAMAAKGSIFHNPSLGQQVTGWEVVGENVGVGPDVDTLHQAFLDSPAHRANLLDGRYREIGIGLARTDGKLWVVEVFRKPVPVAVVPAPAPAPVVAVAPSPAAAPVAVAPAPARRPVAEPAPAPMAVAAPEPAPVPAPVLVESVPTADELADQSGARWGSLVTPAPLALPAAAVTGAGTTGDGAMVDVAGLAAVALWVAAAGLVAAQIHRTGLAGLLPARVALQAA